MNGLVSLSFISGLSGSTTGKLDWLLTVLLYLSRLHSDSYFIFDESYLIFK